MSVQRTTALLGLTAALTLLPLGSASPTVAAQLYDCVDEGGSLACVGFQNIARDSDGNGTYDTRRHAQDGSELPEGTG